MSSIFKFLFYIIITVCFLVAIVYIDNNNLTENLTKQALNNTQISSYSASILGKKAKIDFGFSSNSDDPFNVDISKNGTKEYMYLYPSQVFYASSDEIQILFCDSVFSIPNKIKLTGIKKHLKTSHFLHSGSYVINKKVICGVSKNRGQHKVKLIDGNNLPIGRDTYNAFIKHFKTNYAKSSPQY